MSQQQKVGQKLFAELHFTACCTYHMCMCMLQSESKREEFRRYLEGAGVLDAFTKGKSQELIVAMLNSLSTINLFPAVLVGLYESPEKPPDPLEYPHLQMCCT